MVRKICYLFLILFNLLVFMKIKLLGQVMGVSNSRPIVREYDLVPSSRPAVIEFPNNSVTMNGSTATISYPGSALGPGSTIYQTISSSGNFIDTSGSTQSKTGGLFILGNPVMTSYASNTATDLGNAPILVSTGINDSIFWGTSQLNKKLDNTVINTFGEKWNSFGPSRYWISIAVSANGQIQAGAVSGGNIYVSYDYGVNWNAQGPSQNWSSVAISPDGKYMTGVVSGGKTYTSWDYGVTWTQRTSVNHVFTGVAMSANGKIQTAVPSGENILISYDYGVTWNSVGPVDSWRSVAMSADGLYQSACGAFGYIYTSSDFGQTWTGTSPFAGYWQAIAVSASGKYQAVAYYTGQIYTSTDYGLTWTAGGDSHDFYNIAMDNTGQYIAGSVFNGQICTSKDFGASWSVVDSTRQWVGIGMSADARYITAGLGSGNIYRSVTQENNFLGSLSAPIFESIKASTISLALNGGNTNYIDTSASTQTKTGGLILNGGTTVQGNVSIGAYLTLPGAGSGRSRIFADTSQMGRWDPDANTSWGIGALDSLQFGHSNTAVGQATLTANDDGIQNTAIGYRALDTNTNGSRNSALGDLAGGFLTSGSDNVFLGGLTLGPATANQVSLLGAGASASSGLTNATAIGYGAAVACSNCLVLGNSSVAGVGITANPSSKLDVSNGSVTVRGTNAAIEIANSSGTSLRTSSETILGFNTGEVGIGGILNPQDALHILGNLRLSTSATVARGGCIRFNGSTQILEWSNDCITYATFTSVGNSAGGWTRIGTTEKQSVNTDNVIIGAGATSRATIGLTISQSTQSAYLPNTDIGDAQRGFSLVDENAGQSMVPLSFRSNSGGGANNQMLDIKFVNNNDGTSKLVYSHGPGATFTDRFTFSSGGNFGVNNTTPSSGLDLLNSSITVRGTNAGLTIDGTTARSDIRVNSGDPRFVLVETDAATDMKRWQTLTSGGNLQHGVANDADSLGVTYMQVDRSGTTISSITFPSNALIGIGTTITSSKLDVFNGSITVRGTNAAIRIDGNTGGTGKVFDVMNGTFTVLQNGFIGSGTNAPQAKMHVAGGGNQDLIIGNTGNSQQMLIGTGVGYAAIDAILQGSAFNNLRLNPGGGNIGVGTTVVSSKFDVFNGSITVRGTNASVQMSSATGATTPGTDPRYSTIYTSGTSGVAEGWWKDGAGNATQQTPHDAETNEFIFLSENELTGRIVRIDMERMAHAIEKITGAKFIYESSPLSIPFRNERDTPPDVPDKQLILDLKQQNDDLRRRIEILEAR